jgi:hypothetical protein
MGANMVFCVSGRWFKRVDLDVTTSHTLSPLRVLQYVEICGIPVRSATEITSLYMASI